MPERAPLQPRHVAALVEIGSWLKRQGYCFVTPTPETHRRYISRSRHVRGPRDMFGWSLPIETGRHDAVVPSWVLECLDEAGLLEHDDASVKSAVRWSTLEQDLFVHSAYPTDRDESVFFGPDTYRFAAFIQREVERLAPREARHVVDVGCGSGAGGIVAARALRDPAAHVTLADINPVALRFAEANAALAGLRCATVHSDVLASVEEPIDLAVSNPPYMMDEHARAYRDGGDERGSALSLRIVKECVSRLRPGGSLLLYTGVAIVDGVDAFRESALGWLQGQPVTARYAELDPDVFGEELERPRYADVERIAAVGLVVHKEDSSS